MSIALKTIPQAGPGGDGRATVNFSSAGLNAGAGEVAIADPGAGKAIAIDQINVHYPANDTLTIREDTTTVIGLLTFLTTAHQYSYKPTQPLLLSANTELNLKSGGGNAIAGQIDYHIITT